MFQSSPGSDAIVGVMDSSQGASWPVNCVLIAGRPQDSKVHFGYILWYSVYSVFVLYVIRCESVVFSVVTHATSCCYSMDAAKACHIIVQCHSRALCRVSTHSMAKLKLKLKTWNNQQCRVLSSLQNALLVHGTKHGLFHEDANVTYGVLVG